MVNKWPQALPASRRGGGRPAAVSGAGRCCLVGNDKDFGLLRPDEVSGLKLNAHLVALSDCQTGRSLHYTDEGVRGLARSFLYAGSKAAVCSLWSVDDCETADLMIDFYRNLEKRKSAPEALREAQLAMIRAGNSLGGAR